MSESTDIPEGFKVTELGVLPEGWEVKILGDIVDFKLGRTPPRNDLRYWDNGVYPWVSISDMTEFGQINSTKESISQFAFDTILNGKMIPKGTLFMSFKLTIGRTSILECDAFHNEAIAAIFPNGSEVTRDYLFYYLPTIEFSEYYDTAIKGKTLNKAKIKSLKIPLPPLPEQHAIATTLRTVQEAKEKTDTVIAATKALKAAMMKHLFTYGPVPPDDTERVALKETEIGQVPEGWEVVDLESILNVPVRNGYALNRSNAKGEVRTYTLTAITKNIFSEKYIKNIGVDPSKIENYWLTPGDIYIARANTPEYVGLAALYQGKEKYAIFTDLFVRISVDETKIDPKFLLEFLRMPICRQYYQSRLKHTAGNFPKIDQHIINATKVIIPPTAEQKTISSIIETIDQKLASEQCHKEALDTLFASLLHDLMTAKIRVSPARTVYLSRGQNC